MNEFERVTPEIASILLQAEKDIESKTGMKLTLRVYKSRTIKSRVQNRNKLMEPYQGNIPVMKYKLAPYITQNKLKEIVATALNVPLWIYDWKTRRREAVMARRILAMIIIEHWPNDTLRTIAKHFGEKYDHSSIINLRDRGWGLLEVRDKDFSEQWSKVVNAVNNYARNLKNHKEVSILIGSLNQ